MGSKLMHTYLGAPAPMSACSLFQLPVDVKWISIKRGEHRTPELMRANPLGKVRLPEKLQSSSSTKFCWMDMPCNPVPA